MPKRHHKRSLRGGFSFEDLKQSFTNFGNSIKTGASSMMNNTKKTVSSYQPSTSSMSSYEPSNSSMSSMSSYEPSSTSSMPSYDPSSSSSMSSMSYGGSKRRRGRRGTRRMRGGYMDNISSSNLAATAAKVGGRRRTRKTRRTRKGSKRMRGGYGDNMSLSNLAATAAPFSGPTARAHNWVGGRRKKRRSRTRRH